MTEQTQTVPAWGPHGVQAPRYAPIAVFSDYAPGWRVWDRQTREYLPRRYDSYSKALAAADTLNQS